MTEQYDRERLLTEVWSEPVIHVAKRYGMSNVALKQLCSRLQIPTPTQGHWAKLKVGKGVTTTPALPKFTGHPGHLRIPQFARVDHKTEVVDHRLQRMLDFEQNPANRIAVADKLTKPHSLVELTREALKNPYFDQRDLPTPRGKSLDIKVSKAMLPRALRIADALIKALEIRGYSVFVADRHAEFEILGVRLNVRFFEPAFRTDYVLTAAESAKKARGEWVNIPKPTFTPSGKLHLICTGKVADSAHAPVEDRLNDFVELLAREAVNTLVRQEQQGAKEAERRHQRDVALAMKERQDVEHAKLQKLEQDALNWKRAALLREYLSAFEAESNKAGGISPEQANFLTWAHAKADWLDPLRNEPDPLLDLDIKIPR